MEALAARAGVVLSGPVAITAGLCLAGGLLSVFMNNIGALALMMPLALSICERLV